MKPLNSIYGSHRRVTDKFYTAKSVPGKGRPDYAWEPFARAIQIEGYDDYDFFILRKWKGYGLFEGLTGTLIVVQPKTPSMDLRNRNQQMIAEKIRATLDGMGGRFAINKAMVDFLLETKYIASPRYTKIDEP